MNHLLKFNEGKKFEKDKKDLESNYDNIKISKSPSFFEKDYSFTLDTEVGNIKLSIDNDEIQIRPPESLRKSNGNLLPLSYNRQNRNLIEIIDAGITQIKQQQNINKRSEDYFYSLKESEIEDIFIDLIDLVGEYEIVKHQNTFILTFPIKFETNHGMLDGNDEFFAVMMKLHPIQNRLENLLNSKVGIRLNPLQIQISSKEDLEN